MKEDQRLAVALMDFHVHVTKASVYTPPYEIPFDVHANKINIHVFIITV